MTNYNKMTKEELLNEIKKLQDVIDESKAKEDKMELYSSIIEQTTESVAVTDLKGNYVFINESYEKLRGYTREEIFNREITEHRTPEEIKKRENAFDIVMRFGYWRGELNYYHKSGLVIPTLCTTVLVMNKNSEPELVVGLITDISDIKQAEKSLMLAKKDAEDANQLKSHFLANMSHEIRTPMNAILGYAELLIEEESDLEKKETLEIIHNSGNKLLMLINDILDLSKIEAGKFDIVYKPFQFSDFFKSLKNLFIAISEEKKVSLKMKISKDCPEYVNGDENHLRQVLINIIGNAFKFTKEGEIVVTCLYENGNAEILIKDTGIGIKKDYLEKIFSDFSQADNSISAEFGGTGLGLSISRNLVFLMGGNINLKSEYGSGSTFIVSLPLSISEKIIEERTGFQEAKVKSENNKNGFLKILLAEDNPVNQKLMVKIINKMGYNCDVANNGEIVLVKLREKRYDILLLDIQMPVMDGMEVINIIRRANDLKGLYVIAQTANAMKADQEKYLKAGCNDYISKPINRRVLNEKIRKYISSFPPR